jgi:hypothetical protein
MKMFAGSALEFGRRNSGLSSANSPFFASIPVISRFPSTRLLRPEQFSSDHVQIGERRGDLEPMQVLCQAAIAGLAEAEDVLDHPEHVLDLGAHPRLVAILRLFHFVDPAMEAVASVREVLRLRCMLMNKVCLTVIALVTPDPRLLAVQQIRQRFAVGHVGGRYQDRMDQLRATVDADVRLHPEVPLRALRCLVHLRISPAVLVLRRARRADDRRIHNRALGDLDAAAMQMLVHRRQQHLAELVPFQQVSKLAHRGLIRRPFDPQINADETAHRDRVVQRFLNRRIRQVEPQLQEVDPQHPLQRDRRSATALAHLRVRRLHRRRQFRPRNDLVHVREKLRAARGLPVLLKSRQCRLLHHNPRVTANG